VGVCLRPTKGAGSKKLPVRVQRYVSPEDEANYVKFVLAFAMMTGGLAMGPLTFGGATTALVGADQAQAAARGKETVVYQGARGVGLSDGQARFAEFAAAMPDLPVAMGKAVVASGRAIVGGVGKGLALSADEAGPQIVGAAAKAGAEAAAEKPGQAVAAGARATTEIQAAGAAEGAAAPLVGIPNATRLSEAEQATAARLQAKTGVKLRESPHLGAEYLDELERSYDQVGNPDASQFWNEKNFMASIEGHLLKSNDFTVIDMTGFTDAQISAVRNYVDNLPQASQAKILRIGF
jgi:hypothetical protein